MGGAVIFWISGFLMGFALRGLIACMAESK
jgi:hypothetical protein